MMLKYGPLFSITLAFWKKILASVVLPLNLLLQTQKQTCAKPGHLAGCSSRGGPSTVASHAVCALFSLDWPTGDHGKKWLFRWMRATLICILLASRNPAAVQSPHLDTLKHGASPEELRVSFVKPEPGQAWPSLVCVGTYKRPLWSRQLTVCVPKAQQMHFLCVRGDQCVKCGVKSDSWFLWFLTILCVGRNSLVSTVEIQLRNFL